MKLEINRCHGGFGLSEEAQQELGIEESDQWEVDRKDPRLVSVVERLSDKADGRYAKLLVVEIPDDMPFYIDDWDGFETVHEKHRVFPPLNS